MDGPDVDGPDVDGPDADGPDADGSDVDGPDADGPDVDGPDVDGPDVDGPDVDGPDADGPDTSGSDGASETRLLSDARDWRRVGSTMLRSSPLHRRQHLHACPVRDREAAPPRPRHNLAIDRHGDAARIGLEVEYSQQPGNSLLVRIIVRSAVEVDHEEEMGSCLVS